MDVDGNNSKQKPLSNLDRSPQLNNQTERDKGGKSYKNVWKKVDQNYNAPLSDFHIFTIYQILP